MKNTIPKKLSILGSSLIIAAVLLSSCKKKDDAAVSTANEPYAIALRAQGGSGSSTDYVLQVGSLMEGEISAEGKGIEQAGWNYYMGSGNAVFSINYGEDGTIAYDLNSAGRLQERGRFWVDRLDCIGSVDENMAVGIGAPWGGGSFDCELMVIDAEKVAISSRRTHNLYKYSNLDTLNKWPTGAVTVGNNIFVPFYPLGGQSWLTPIMDTAFISIYKYPTLEYVKTIKDTRTAPIGLYGSIPSIIKTETGDIYTISPNAYAAGYTQTGKPSGILRVKSGETEFDASYFLNFETAFNGKTMMISYLGNGKALVRYIPVSADDENDIWAAYDVANPICKLAIVDLESKAITAVDGIPDHGGGYGGNGAVFVENGKAYLSITSTVEGEVRIYEIDILTATAKKGALVKGEEAPLIYKLHN